MLTASTPHPQPVPSDGASVRREPRRGLTWLPVIAGAGYLTAWVAGLSVWPSNLALDATSTQVAASYRSHAAQAVAQYLLVEGLAGILFGAVLAAAVMVAGQAVWARPAAVLGSLAVVISLIQCVLGLLLTAAASAHHVSMAGDLFGLANRLDGVKMLALAGAAAYLATRIRPAQPMPQWLRVTAALAAAALTVSGVTYLLLAQALAWAVYLSGPLLLAWITATGGWLTAAGRRRTMATR
ncbi:MAG: hypothetical protein ABJB47_05135 [Actinomycetota bacterium]